MIGLNITKVFSVRCFRDYRPRWLHYITRLLFSPLSFSSCFPLPLVKGSKPDATILVDLPAFLSISTQALRMSNLFYCYLSLTHHFCFFTEQIEKKECEHKSHFTIKEGKWPTTSMYATSDQICTALSYLSIGTCLRECVAAKCEIKVVCSKQWHKTAHRFVVLWERKKMDSCFQENTRNRVGGLRSAVAPQDQVQMFSSSPAIRCFISHSSWMMDAGLSRTFVVRCIRLLGDVLPRIGYIDRCGPRGGTLVVCSVSYVNVGDATIFSPVSSNTCFS